MKMSEIIEQHKGSILNPQGLVKLTKLYTGPEFTETNNRHKELGYANEDSRVFIPGTGWEMPWFFNPEEDDPQYYRGILSDFYLNTWARIRPPICLVCPNGRHWIIDQKSVAPDGKLRPGWQVTGVWPNISCHPSINVPGYHGWLTNGVLVADVEQRGNYGLVNERAPYLPGE